MIGATEVKPGMALRLENQLFYVTQYQHVKPGKGGAFIRLKLKNAETGAVLDRTARARSSIRCVSSAPRCSTSIRPATNITS